jgi:hypothetical protein
MRDGGAYFYERGYDTGAREEGEQIKRYGQD